jgi:hypothetical protein
MGRIRDFVSGKDRTEETCAFVAKVFAPEATTIPLYVPADMVADTKKACPNIWIEEAGAWRP